MTLAVWHSRWHREVQLTCALCVHSVPHAMFQLLAMDWPEFDEHLTLRAGESSLSVLLVHRSSGITK